MSFPVDGVDVKVGLDDSLWTFLRASWSWLWSRLHQIRIPRRGTDPRAVRLLTFRVCEKVGLIVLTLFVIDLVVALTTSPADPFRGIEASTRNLARGSFLIYIFVVAWLFLLKTKRLRVPEHDAFHVPAPYQILLLLLPLLLAEGRVFSTVQPFHVVCDVTPAIVSLYVGAQLLFIDRRSSDAEEFSSALDGSGTLIGGATVKAIARLQAVVSMIRKMPYLIEYFSSAFEGRARYPEFRRLLLRAQRQLIGVLKNGKLVSTNYIEIDLQAVTGGMDPARLLVITACANVHRVIRRRVGFMNDIDASRILLTAGARDGLLMALEYEQKAGER
jgi:hypothetical protein